MLAIGPEKNLTLIEYCVTCFDEPHVDDEGKPLVCPEVVRAGGEGE